MAVIDDLIRLLQQTAGPLPEIPQEHLQEQWGLIRSADPDQATPAPTPEAVVRDPESFESNQAHPSTKPVVPGSAAHAVLPSLDVGEQASAAVRPVDAGAAATVAYAESNRGGDVSPLPPQQSVLPAANVRAAAVREGDSAQPIPSQARSTSPADFYASRIVEGIPAEALGGSARSGKPAIELPFETVVGMSAVPLQQPKNHARPADPVDLQTSSGRTADAEFVFPRGADVNAILREFARVDRLRIMDGVQLPPFTIHSVPMLRPTTPVEPTAVTTAKRFPVEPEGRYVL